MVTNLDILIIVQADPTFISVMIHCPTSIVDPSSRDVSESETESDTDSCSPSTTPHHTLDPHKVPEFSEISDVDTEPISNAKRRYKKLFILRVAIRIVAVSTMIIIAIKLELDIHSYLESVLDSIHGTIGTVWAPILFCIVCSIWTSLSPLGYFPTVLCGIFFQWYIAPIIAYISINIGSLCNVLIIRYIILPNKTRCGIKQILHCCCGRKMGQIPMLKQLFLSVPNPIRVVVLLRLPYLNNGVINYLFSLQVDSLTITQNVIGNLIGFIPGSIIFSIFGNEMRSLAKVIGNGGFEDMQQMVLFIVVLTVCLSCYIVIAVKVKKLINRVNPEIESNDVRSPRCEKEEERHVVVV